MAHCESYNAARNFYSVVGFGEKATLAPITVKDRSVPHAGHRQAPENFFESFTSSVSPCNMTAPRDLHHFTEKAWKHFPSFL